MNVKKYGILVSMLFLVGSMLPYGARAQETATVTEDFGSTGRREERGTLVFWDTRNKEVTLPLRYTAQDLSARLQHFDRQSVTAIGTDSGAALIGGSGGALNLLEGSSAATDISATIATLAARVNAIGFIPQRGLWIIGGQAKRGSGALLYTVMQGSLAALDFQAQAKAAELDRIDRIVCEGSACTLYGVKGFSTPRSATFDGTTVTRLEGTGSPARRFADVAAQFSRIPANKIRADAVVADEGRFTYVASGGLYVNLASGLELTGGRVPELQGADIRVLKKRSDGAMLAAGVRQGKVFLAEVALQGFISSAGLETKKMADAGSGRFFKRATLTPMVDLPSGTQIEYLISADDGAHYEPVVAGLEHEFITYTGGALRLRAVLSSTDASVTPHLFKFRIDLTKAEVEGPALYRKRDSERANEFRDLQNRLERFKKDRGVYPIVDGRAPEIRFNQLSQLLLSGGNKYITKMPQDPLNDEQMDRRYDYVSTAGGSAYLLLTKLDEEQSALLKKDVDGKPVEPELFEYACDDPWYCVGKGLVTPSAGGPPVPAGVVELLQDDGGRVWRIATIGGGAVPVQKRRLYIPSPELLTKLSNFYARMQRVGRDTVEQYPRARLVKAPDKNDVYYLTANFLKRRIPSWNVFLSYGNDPREIVTVKSEELAAYGESRLIRLEGDIKVWLLENGTRRWIRSEEVMKKHGFNFENVSPVNFPEYNSYSEGPPLE